ncbi:MAG: hypothetical protein R2776_04700 [Flavobacteriaceae bacterium]
MSFQITYKKLVSINCYHHYFLDDGTTAFDSSTNLKAAQLLKYNFNQFLKIIPSEKTQQQFLGYKIIYKVNNAGIDVFIKAEETVPNSGIFKPFIPLEQTESFVFLIYISDSLFENYSTVSAIPSIPYFFSNKKPTTEGGIFRYIDLEATTHDIEDFTISQATYETFMGSITEKERLGLFGIIHIEMAGDDTTGVDGNVRIILNGDGTLQDPAPAFKLQMENRETIWNYINPVDNTLIHSSYPTLLPLVKNGIIGYTFDSKERPSAQPDRLVFEKDGGGNIIKTISEIFIN